MSRERQWLGSWPQQIGSLLVYGTRHGYDSANIERDYERYMRRTGDQPRPTPWLFRGNNGQLALATLCVLILAWLWLDR
jgi:hypothetical protein